MSNYCFNINIFLNKLRTKGSLSPIVQAQMQGLVLLFLKSFFSATVKS